jgi:hypothetical protein
MQKLKSFSPDPFKARQYQEVYARWMEGLNIAAEK